MKANKFKRFEIRKPKWDPNPEKSTTNNSEWRKGLFVIFEDYNGNVYDYMPKWIDIEELNRLHLEIENINKSLCKEQKKI